jgi:mono/diheme cytochrome c family protein
MMSSKILSAIGVAVIVLAISSAQAQSTADAGSTAVSAPAVDAPVPAKIFEQRCAGCHGADGSGPNHPHKGVAIPSFRDAKWQSEHDDAALRSIITNGVPGKHMPAFKDRLSVAQIDAAAQAVRSFAGSASAQ